VAAARRPGDAGGAAQTPADGQGASSTHATPPRLVSRQEPPQQAMATSGQGLSGPHEGAGAKYIEFAGTIIVVVVVAAFGCFFGVLGGAAVAAAVGLTAAGATAAALEARRVATVWAVVAPTAASLVPSTKKDASAAVFLRSFAFGLSLSEVS